MSWQVAGGGQPIRADACMLRQCASGCLRAATIDMPAVLGLAHLCHGRAGPSLFYAALLPSPQTIQGLSDLDAVYSFQDFAALGQEHPAPPGEQLSGAALCCKANSAPAAATAFAVARSTTPAAAATIAAAATAKAAVAGGCGSASTCCSGSCCCRFPPCSPAPAPPKAEDICTIMYTSGTTGKPKARAGKRVCQNKPLQ